MHPSEVEWATLPDWETRQAWVEEQARVKVERERERQRKVVRRSRPLTPDGRRRLLQLAEVERARLLRKIRELEREGFPSRPDAAQAQPDRAGGAAPTRPEAAVEAALRVRKVVRPNTGYVIAVR